MPMSAIWRCTAKGPFTTRGSPTRRSTLSRRAPSKDKGRPATTASRASSRRCISTSCPCRRQSRRPAASTAPQQGTERRSSTARRGAAPAMCRRLSRNRVGTPTRRRKSGSTISRPKGRPTGATAPVRCALYWTQKVHKGGFYHDGRFADLHEVVDHYDDHFHLQLTDQEKSDLIAYL